jgi:hypothetical protein
MFDGKPTDVEAVEDHAKQYEDRACQEGIGICAILFDGKPDDGYHDANKDLCPEEDAHGSAGKEITEVTRNGEFAEFEEGIDAEDDGKRFGEFFKQMSLKPALEVARTE